MKKKVWKSIVCCASMILSLCMFTVHASAAETQAPEPDVQLLGIETFAPEVSVVCNLAPDHLDYMPSVEAYYESKMRIYENCQKEDWFLRNVDDPTVVAYAKNIPCKAF